MRTNLLLAGLVVSILMLTPPTPVLGQPTEFSDDFVTVVTYNSSTLLAPCYGGPPPKYSLVDFDSQDIFNQHAASGSGLLRHHNTILSSGPRLGSDIWTVIGWVGVNAGCPGEPPFFASDTKFTNDQLCMYGGVQFNAFQLRTAGPGIKPSSFGSDGQPGFAGVDDDNDSVTDEIDEQAATTQGTFKGTFRDSTRGALGPDNEPGVAGVDDDGFNGTDDQGEIGWAGSDDSDDGHGLFVIGPFMRQDIGPVFPPETLGVLFQIVPGNGSMFIRGVTNGGTDGPSIEQSDEISSGFFNPYTKYNYVFCACGTVYGRKRHPGSWNPQSLWPRWPRALFFPLATARLGLRDRIGGV